MSAVQREWRVIDGFPDYEMTSDGDIRRRGDHLKMHVAHGDIRSVLLTKDGKRYHRSVNALVRNTYSDLSWYELLARQR